MLDKLKLFNKDKSDKSKTHVSKRTSSSSGFSSARSERSDSSLSLNETNSTLIQQQSIQPNKSSTKKGDTANSAKTNTSSKSSKLISSKSSSKETLSQNNTLNSSNAQKSSNKPDKKEKDKSPQRTENTLQQIAPPTKIQKTETKLKQQVIVGRKPEVKSEQTKTSLVSHIQQPTKTLIQPSVNTGIPKPMAAIKGTTKASIPENQGKKDDYFENMKAEKSVNNNNNNNFNTNGNPIENLQKTQVVNPMNVHNSPLHNHLLNQNNNNSISVMTDSSHSVSTGPHSNSSESSVIFRPSSESGSDIFHHSLQQTTNKNPIPNRKLDNFNDPLMTNGNINYNKFNTVPSKINGNISNTMATTIFEEEKQMTIMPMRPIMRGYNSHVTLPTRGGVVRNGQHITNDYEDHNQQGGYCSDGDALRKISVRYSDIDNGYLSESGVTNPHFANIFKNRIQLPTTIEER